MKKFDKKIKPLQGLQRFFAYATVKLPILGVVKDEPEFGAATSLNDLVARLANFSQIAEEAIKETEEKDVFLDGMDFFE